MEFKKININEEVKIGDKITVTGRSNETYDFEGGYISFNSKILEGIAKGGLSKDINDIGEMFGKSTSGIETALCLDDGSFRILDGDFREEYLRAKNIREMLNIFNKYKDEFENSWSSYNEETFCDHIFKINLLSRYKKCRYCGKVKKD